MKRTFSVLLSLALILALTACGPAAGQDVGGTHPAPEGDLPASIAPEGDLPASAPPEGDTPASAVPEAPPAGQPEDAAPSESETAAGADSGGKKILIAYFSATNNTENIANHLESILNADLYEIVPETPYTPDDLNYSDTSSRSSKEMNDPDARPAISGSAENMGDYDVVFLGYPIWWGEAPRIISTFLESYDLSGKTIVPFCTSASSPMGSSAGNLQDLSGGAEWLEGRRFSGSASVSDVQSWVDSLNLNG